MSGWKARIGYLSPSVFEIHSEWDLILPKGFTLVASGLNVHAHTTDEFNRAIDALEAGLGIFTAEECDVILLAGITLGTQRGYQIEQEVVAKLSQRVALPVSTGMNATVVALKHMGAKTIVGINDNALSRAIVFHSHWFIFWSGGCFVTPGAINKRLIDLTRDGTLLYVHRTGQMR